MLFRSCFPSVSCCILFATLHFQSFPPSLTSSLSWCFSLSSLHTSIPCPSFCLSFCLLPPVLLPLPHLFLSQPRARAWLPLLCLPRLPPCISPAHTHVFCFFPQPSCLASPHLCPPSPPCTPTSETPPCPNLPALPLWALHHLSTCSFLWVQMGLQCSTLVWVVWPIWANLTMVTWS